MPKRIFLAIGLLTLLVMRVHGQETTISPDAWAGASSVEGSAADSAREVFTFLPESDVWFTGDFVFGWVEGAHLGSLVTTSPNGTGQAVAGVLGESTTSTLLSGTVNPQVQPGFRLAGGYVFSQEKGLGIEAGFLFLANRSSSFAFNSDDTPILARPYIDATSGDPAAVLVAFPGNSTGSINVESKSDNFYTVNLDLNEQIWDGGSLRFDGIFGYRFASYNNALRIRQRIVATALPDTTVDSFDDFGAKNTFHGLDFGFRTTYSWNERLSVNLLTKVAAGNMHRSVNIRGRQVTTVGGVSSTVSGGVNALDSNIGNRSSNDGAVLPEAGLNLNWRFRSNMNLRVGYSLLYLGRAARADDQIDFTINPNLFPPASSVADPRRPTFPDQTSNIWIQTLNLGVDVTF
jgi:hypothetical protein